MSDEIAEALALEVGKNRMEALGETQETVDFFRHYADDFESHAGFDHAVPNDPLPGVISRNRSIMRPYGVLVVIAPFTSRSRWPAARSPPHWSPATPWSSRARPIRPGRAPAGRLHPRRRPAGVQLPVGLGADVGAVLWSAIRRWPRSPAPWPWARSRRQQTAGGAWPRPCIAEMGGVPGPNAPTSTWPRPASRARPMAWGGAEVLGIVVLLMLHARVADALDPAPAAPGHHPIRMGDPTRREHWLGPVVNAAAYVNYARYAGELQGGRCAVAHGWAASARDAGWRAATTSSRRWPKRLGHRLWRQEILLVLLLQRVRDREEAMRLANDSDKGLTAGFYGGADVVSTSTSRRASPTRAGRRA